MNTLTRLVFYDIEVWQTPLLVERYNWTLSWALAVSVVSGYRKENKTSSQICLPVMNTIICILKIHVCTHTYVPVKEKVTTCKQIVSITNTGWALFFPLLPSTHACMCPWGVLPAHHHDAVTVGYWYQEATTTTCVNCWTSKPDHSLSATPHTHTHTRAYAPQHATIKFWM